ncbi:MAG: zf-HC2 domain-containing protein [bacterium]
MNDKNSKPDRSECPDEILINRYVLHQCSSKERKEIEAHLIECSLCRYEVVSLTDSQPEIQDDKKWGDLPERVFEKGLELIKKMQGSQKAPLEICLKFIQNKWNIIRHTGILIPQPTLALRRETSLQTDQVSTLIKEFNGYRVEADIKGNKEGTLDLKIRVKKSTEENLLSKVDFSLRDQKRQRILAESTRDGMICFEGILPGDYFINIKQSGQIIGEISIHLEI